MGEERQPGLGPTEIIITLEKEQKVRTSHPRVGTTCALLWDRVPCCGHFFGAVGATAFYQAVKVRRDQSADHPTRCSVLFLSSDLHAGWCWLLFLSG